MYQYGILTCTYNLDTSVICRTTGLPGIGSSGVISRTKINLQQLRPRYPKRHVWAIGECLSVQSYSFRLHMYIDRLSTLEIQGILRWPLAHRCARSRRRRERGALRHVAVVGQPVCNPIVIISSQTLTSFRRRRRGRRRPSSRSTRLLTC